MSVLTIPDDKGKWYPSLGGQVCDFIEENLVFGPGDLRGMPAKLDDDKRGLIWRMYEVYPRRHRVAGRRRFKRVGISLAKGMAKTELAAWIAICELHPESPVRCVGFDRDGNPIGGPVNDPYIPVVAYTEEQSDELLYGTIKVILEECDLGKDFDIGLERIMRKRGDGKVVSLSSSPNARDGARTTFSAMDEPLALDTHIPTPDGWTTMGDIHPGDIVFGADGHPAQVREVGPIHHNRQCYAIKFGDGSRIVADAHHGWPVYDHSPSYKCERTVATEYLYEHQWSHSSRFRIVESGPLELPDKELPVAPYLMGLWLGDGDARNATITAGKQDIEEIEANIKALGYRVTRCSARGRAPLIYITMNDSRYSGWGATKGKPINHSVVGELRKIGVLENKHIPDDYLRAGTQQRLELLRGLMDADGYISPQGVCTFVNTSEWLIDGLIELLRTLGYRPHPKCASIDKRWAKESTIYKVHFTGKPNMMPFRLYRKSAKITEHKWQYQCRAIIAVEAVETIPVRCISVDNDEHLFLAGEAMIATHNTHWWTLPRLLRAHQTMVANLAKRKKADPWNLEITTAPEPGAGSVAESAMEYAREVKEGRIKDTRFFYYHRQASDEHPLNAVKDIRAAVIEASGMAASWRDIDAIVALSQDPTTDMTFFDRVYCNRLVKASQKAFDIEEWKPLAKKNYRVKDRALITLGFDGAMFHDSVGLVGTEIETGYQFVLGLWECPYGKKDWQAPVEEIEEAVVAAFENYDVWRLYADPQYWLSYTAQWAGLYGKERVVEWYTNRYNQMCYAIEAFSTAIKSGELSHDNHKGLARHIGNAFKQELNKRDEQGKRLWVIHKERGDSPNKIDLAMAAILSWKARLDAVALNVNKRSAYEDEVITIG